MQRRAAAMYFVFFVVVGAVAYGFIATTSAPTVAMDGPTYAQGDTVTLDGRTYRVTEISEESSGGGGHGGGGGSATVTGTIAWTNESAVVSTQLDNGSTVPAVDVVWEDQRARTEVQLEAGSTVPFQDGEYRLTVDADAPAFTLTSTANASRNSTFGTGDTLTYRGNEATVTAISADTVTLVWGDPYLVAVPNVSSPSSFTFVQQRNVTALAAADPALYDETVRIDGVRYVTYRDNDTNVPVEEYFGPVGRQTFEVGDTLRYRGNETTVESITADAVTLTRPGEETTEIELSEGGNFTVTGTTYFAHFPSSSSVQILSAERSYASYARQNERIDAYHDRKLGLWGVTELSIAAAIILLGTAFLPVRG